MRKDLLDEDAALGEANVGYKTALIASDVEDYDPTLTKVIGAGKSCLEVRPVGEVRASHEFEPDHEGFFRVGVALPEAAQGSGGDDIHNYSIWQRDI